MIIYHSYEAIYSDAHCNITTAGYFVVSPQTAAKANARLYSGSFWNSPKFHVQKEMTSSSHDVDYHLSNGIDT